jgi:hypothetical protein
MHVVLLRVYAMKVGMRGNNAPMCGGMLFGYIIGYDEIFRGILDFRCF